MYIYVSVCLSVPRRIPTLLHGPGCNLGNGRGCRLVVHYWADLQSVHGFRCYDNIAMNSKCEQVLICLVWNLVVVEDVKYTGRSAVPAWDHETALDECWLIHCTAVRRHLTYIYYHMSAWHNCAECDTVLRIMLLITPCLKKSSTFTACYNFYIHSSIATIFGKCCRESRQLKCTLFSQHT